MDQDTMIQLSNYLVHHQVEEPLNERDDMERYVLHAKISKTNQVLKETLKWKKRAC